MTETMSKMDLSDENKWAMICQNNKLQVKSFTDKNQIIYNLCLQDFRTKGRIEGTPQYWTNKIKVEPSVELMKELQAVLATESLAWIGSFIEGDGLSAILDLLGEVEHSLHVKSLTKTLKKQDQDVKLQAELIHCLRPLTNNKVRNSSEISLNRFRPLKIKHPTNVCLLQNYPIKCPNFPSHNFLHFHIPGS